MAIGWILLGLIGILAVVIAVRTVIFKPEITSHKVFESIPFDKEKALDHFSELLKIKTITYHEAAFIDDDAFETFKKTLKSLYPLVHEKLAIHYIEKRGILMHWCGSAADKPLVLMSHYDVVPVNEDKWSVPPFSGHIDDTFIWGRGTIDTKLTLVGILEAAETLLEKSFVPAQDIYFSFGGDEEISGDAAPAIVSYLKEKDIRPYLVVDEGGAIVSGVFPGVEKPCAFVGIGEKGYIDLEVSLSGKGGHSSSPPPKTLTQELARAITRLEKKPLDAEISLPARALFDTLGRHSTLMYRIIFANLWCFSPLLKWQFKRSGGEMNALIRSTVSVTMLTGSKAYNILPSEVRMGINVRLLEKDKVDDVIKRVRDLLGKTFHIKIVESREASPYTSVDGEQWTFFKEAIESVYSGVAVSPYLMLGASDSRHYAAIAEAVLRFSPMVLTPDELSRMHSHDERVSKENYYQAIDFFIYLMTRYK